jgi:FtsZ-binding cell division protein ZapB
MDLQKKLDVRIEEYKEKIKKLDSYAQKLSKENLEKYQSARERFERRLASWEESLRSDFLAFRSNVEEGYDELEAYITRRK